MTEGKEGGLSSRGITATTNLFSKRAMCPYKSEYSMNFMGVPLERGAR